MAILLQFGCYMTLALAFHNVLRSLTIDRHPNALPTRSIGINPVFRFYFLWGRPPLIRYAICLGLFGRIHAFALDEALLPTNAYIRDRIDPFVKSKPFLQRPLSNIDLID